MKELRQRLKRFLALLNLNPQDEILRNEATILAELLLPMLESPLAEIMKREINKRRERLFAQEN